MLTLLIAVFIPLIIGVFRKRITQRTKTEIDDLILRELTKPMRNIILTVGIANSILHLSVLEPFQIYVEAARFVFIVWIGMVFALTLVGQIIEWYTQTIAIKTETTLDDEFLIEITEWREMLAKNIALRYYYHQI